MNRLSLGLSLLLTAGAAHGVMHVTDSADFISGENTNGWIVSDGQWTSPAYPVPVASFTAVGTNLSEGASLSVSYSQNRFAINRTGGDARLSAFTVDYVVSRLPVPAGFAVTNIIEGSFAASWQPVADAICYRLSFYTNRLDGVSAGTSIFDEEFSAIPSKGTSTSLDEDTFNALTDTRAGWTFENCCYGVNTAGVVQVGMASKPGWLAMSVPQACAGTGRTLRIAAWNYSSSIGPDMPVRHISADGSETNVVAVVALDNVGSNIYVSLPELAAGDKLVFHSTTNKDHTVGKDGRVNLDAVQILDGYDPGHYVLDCHATADVVGTAFTTNGMPALDGFVTLKACSANAADDSDETEPLELNLAHPPLMPILRAVPMSTLDEGVYEADFSVLTNITSQTTWYNGVWPIKYWMGYNDKGEIATTLRVGTTNTTYTGFFAVTTHYPYTTEPRTIDYALGFRMAKDRDGHHGIAFLNDTQAPRTNFRITRGIIQWNYNNKLQSMTNTVEYLVTNELVGTAAKGNWISIPELTFTPPYTATYNDGGAEYFSAGHYPTVTLDNVTLGIGEYLIVRFSDWRSSDNKGAAGLYLFKLESERKRAASFMLIR